MTLISFIQFNNARKWTLSHWLVSQTDQVFGPHKPYRERIGVQMGSQQENWIFEKPTNSFPELGQRSGTPSSAEFQKITEWCT